MILSFLDMRHRLSLSGQSAPFDVIDPVLFNSFMDPTAGSITELYSSKIKETFVGDMSTEVICDKCRIVSVVDTEYGEIYISLNNSIEEDILQTQNFSRSQCCNRCNDTSMHNCHSTFITMPYILVLVIRRFDACLR